MADSYPMSPMETTHSCTKQSISFSHIHFSSSFWWIFDLFHECMGWHTVEKQRFKIINIFALWVPGTHRPWSLQNGSHQQSGTKPNLVAKVVAICNGLPKLVANISSHIDHLVNTGLAVGSLVKWLPIKVATPANQTQSEWFIARRL